MFAVLLMVLAPTLSRAFSAEPSSARFWMEICSAFGGKKADAPASGDERLVASAHCPYCLVHADVLTPPPGVAVNETIFTMSHLLPRLFYRAPQPLFAWTVAPSRAPPAAA
ncbi:Protein of unknown function (DUF2946) [Herbaspirillum sp. CF444]|uniref:DUF2946 domain-containing protein n=1 Tax=Herbaspirillum sp. CF444 TaxID=1144319 RepID=UPI00027273E0|nr:DUF2946 domain-containing protein [Herbaspirillum sp. CF444]EJL87905.1 Protein of unknown function (DUF2946) [Herbaspirillum sp. CF444]